MTAGRVRTVLSNVPAAELGPTHCHEHLITRPSPAFTRSDPDLVLDDHDAAGRELRAFARAGGGTIVEVSCAEFGRDPAGLAALSRRTGVHVGAATEHVVEAQWAGVEVGARTEPELVAEMVEDLTVGFRNAPAVIVPPGRPSSACTTPGGALITIRIHGGTDMAQVRSWDGLDVHPAKVVAAKVDRESRELVASSAHASAQVFDLHNPRTFMRGCRPLHHHRMPRPTIHID